MNDEWPLAAGLTAAGEPSKVNKINDLKDNVTVAMSWRPGSPIGRAPLRRFAYLCAPFIRPEGGHAR
jgi:hypothetical protein